MRTIFAAAVIGMIALAAPAAGAGPRAQSTSCTLQAQASFSPGVRLTAHTQTITVSGKLTSCTGGGVTGGTIIAKGSGSLSCTAGTANVTAKVTWNTGAVSWVHASIDVGSGAVTGSVFAGKFSGETVSGSASVTPVTGNCVITPMTKAKLSGTAAV